MSCADYMIMGLLVHLVLIIKSAHDIVIGFLIDFVLVSYECIHPFFQRQKLPSNIVSHISS